MKPTTTTWLTVAKAADILGYSPHATALLAQNGVLESTDINGVIRVNESSVASYLERTR